MPAMWAPMIKKLVEYGRTVYQTAYAEPGTAVCLTGPQAAAYYAGHNICIEGGPGYHPSLPGKCNESIPRKYLGPVCFHTLPPLPPLPPPPPTPPPPSPPSPSMALARAG